MFKMILQPELVFIKGKGALDAPKITINAHPTGSDIDINIEEDANTYEHGDIGCEIHLTPQQAKDLTFALNKAIFDATNYKGKDFQTDDDMPTFQPSTNHPNPPTKRKYKGPFNRQRD